MSTAHLSNADPPLPGVNALLQLLVLVLGTHVFSDIGSLIICQLTPQVFVQSLFLQTPLKAVKSRRRGRKRMSFTGRG